MRKHILLGLCNIASALGVAFCGRAALETTDIFSCILYWIGVYAILDLYVYLKNLD
jgi:hypothetical protein